MHGEEHECNITFMILRAGVSKFACTCLMMKWISKMQGFYDRNQNMVDDTTKDMN
jgi:hypothetical protein